MEKHFKQLIIARRDLNMSPGKLAAQVSSAFLIVDACRTPESPQGTLTYGGRED